MKSNDILTIVGVGALVVGGIWAYNKVKEVVAPAAAAVTTAGNVLSGVGSSTAYNPSPIITPSGTLNTNPQVVPPLIDVFGMNQLTGWGASFLNSVQSTLSGFSTPTSSTAVNPSSSSVLSPASQINALNLQQGAENFRAELAGTTPGMVYGTSTAAGDIFTVKPSASSTAAVSSPIVNTSTSSTSAASRVAVSSPTQIIVTDPVTGAAQKVTAIPGSSVLASQKVITSKPLSANEKLRLGLL